MINFSRRQLARYAVDELLAKRPTAVVAKRVAAYLAAAGRSQEVELLLSDIDRELEDRGLLAKVRVTTAHPLSATLRNELTAKVKRATAAEDTTLEEQLDKDLVGGLRIETANHSWDRTLTRMLNDIKEIA